MKTKDVVFRLKSNLFQNFHRQYCKNGGFTILKWSKVDVQYFERLWYELCILIWKSQKSKLNLTDLKLQNQI